MARKSWSDLSAASRTRLETAGRTGKLVPGDYLSPADVRAYHDSGGDLRGAYGHAPKVPNRAPTDVLAAAQRGKLTRSEDRALAKWRRANSPPWVPTNKAAIGDDTAAILSAIDLPPARWRSVTFGVLDDGRVSMTVTPKGGGYRRQVILPDRSSMSDVARLIQNPIAKGATPAEQERLRATWGSKTGSTGLTVNASGTDSARTTKGGGLSGTSGKGATGTTRGRAKGATTSGGKRTTSGTKATSRGRSSGGSTGRSRNTTRTPPRTRTKAPPAAPAPSPRDTGLGDLIDQAAGLAADDLDAVIAELQRIAEGRR